MTVTYPFPVSKDEFRGKRVLVTGGTKGMGQAMVRRFTLSGASVATTARSPLPEEQAVALFVQTDIGTAAGVQEAISRIQHEWGGLDILVNNVGGSDTPNGGYRALSDDDWQKALNVNLLASRLSIPARYDRTQIRCHSSHLVHPAPSAAHSVPPGEKSPKDSPTSLRNRCVPYEMFAILIRKSFFDSFTSV
jgi:NAD(P)-dependent dehydrogenase (short-subunit alcohol dehydrogenase family)